MPARASKAKKTTPKAALTETPAPEPEDSAQEQAAPTEAEVRRDTLQRLVDDGWSLVQAGEDEKGYWFEVERPGTGRGKSTHKTVRVK